MKMSTKLETKTEVQTATNNPGTDNNRDWKEFYESLSERLVSLNQVKFWWNRIIHNLSLSLSLSLSRAIYKEANNLLIRYLL